jgi:hypothetical protein
MLPPLRGQKAVTRFPPAVPKSCDDVTTQGSLNECLERRTESKTQAELLLASIRVAGGRSIRGNQLLGIFDDHAVRFH